jgi:hypothetical protein
LISVSETGQSPGKSAGAGAGSFGFRISDFTNPRAVFTVDAFMRAFLFLTLLPCLFCAGCSNKYGDDPRYQGLPTPAATPVPTATPIER